MKKIVFVFSYRDAPQQAQYILRDIGDNTWALEHYYDTDCRVLRYFNISTIPGQDEKDFEGALKVCEEFVKGSETVLYVEKPSFMFSEDDVDEMLSRF